MAGDREGSEVFLMKKTPVALPHRNRKQRNIQHIKIKK